MRVTEAHWVVNIEKARFKRTSRSLRQPNQSTLNSCLLCHVDFIGCGPTLIFCRIIVQGCHDQHHASYENGGQPEIESATDDWRFLSENWPVSLSLLKQQEAISCTNRRSVPLSPTIYALTCMFHKLQLLQTQIFYFASFGL